MCLLLILHTPLLIRWRNYKKLTQSRKSNLASSCLDDCASAFILNASASLVKTFVKNTRSSMLSVVKARHTAR